MAPRWDYRLEMLARGEGFPPWLGCIALGGRERGKFGPLYPSPLGDDGYDISD